MTRHYNNSRPRIHGREALDAENLEAQQLWNYLRLRDPATGEIPRGIHTRELAYARTIGTNRPALKGTPTIHTTGWNSAGPINAGGRTRAIGIDTMNEAIVLIATAQGGIFRSTDSGQTWARTTALGELKNMSSLVQDHRPGKTGTWYAGTGELISTIWRRSAINTDPIPHSPDVGNGIYKSIDDGLTWNVLPSTVDATPVTLDSTFDGVWNIVVDNSRRDSDIVYAAGYGAIMRSNNGGTTWQHVLGDPTHISEATDVAITSSGILYTFLSGETADGNVSTTAGVWRSTDGFHWTNISPDTWPAGTGRMRIAIAPADESMIYIGGFDPDFGDVPAFYAYTYLSGNGAGTGGQWDDRSQNIPTYTGGNNNDGILCYGGYTIVLKVYPTDPNTVFFGGTNLYRSSDGFASGTNIDWIGGYDPGSNGTSEYTNNHPDNHAIEFLPSNPLEAYDANDGGIYQTYDILGYDDPTYPVTWQNNNYEDQASIIYDVALDHATPGDSTVLGGFQDQGSWLSYDSANLWYQWDGGDGCYCAIADHKAAYYMSSQDGYVSRWKISSNYSYRGYAGIMPTSAPLAQFVTPWMLDPANTDQMYFASNNLLFRNNDLAAISDNQGVTTDQNWVQLTRCTLSSNSFFTALGMSTVPAHRLYYGTSDGHLYRVDNADGASPTPQEITGSIFPKNAFICCVAVDPQNADSIVVCFSNYHVISIIASNDGGVTWHDASGNLEQNPDGSGDGPSVRWVTIVHQQGETLYLCGTSVGLFSATDISGQNVTWNPEGVETIGRAIVENIDARQSDGFVAIATQGSGVYTTHIVASPSAVGSNSAAQFAFTLSPNPSAGRVEAVFTLTESGQIKWTVVDVTGRTVLSPNTTEFPAGASGYILDCTRLPTGTYFVQLQAGDAIETRRLIIER
ncbi:MAG TPA: T9SS type A sorting domain-containing protein [Candidatus Kapabacteria bacterium]|nr:T9SS type A sorting domain-containing protein [Candidatus Kapabacteria bacterium]